MVEVLTKAEKYINGEEALISKKGSPSTYKEKRGTDKRQGRSLSDKETRRGPQRKTENGPQKDVEALEIDWVHLSPSSDSSIHLDGLPP